MKQHHSFGDFLSSLQFITKDMSKGVFTFNIESSIVVFIPVSHPKPAIIWSFSFSDSVPKEITGIFSCDFSSGFVVTFLTTMRAKFKIFETGRSSHHFFSTPSTDLRSGGYFAFSPASSTTKISSFSIYMVFGFSEFFSTGFTDTFDIFCHISSSLSSNTAFKTTVFLIGSSFYFGDLFSTNFTVDGSVGTGFPGKEAFFATKVMFSISESDRNCFKDFIAPITGGCDWNLSALMIAFTTTKFSVWMIFEEFCGSFKYFTTYLTGDLDLFHDLTSSSKTFLTTKFTNSRFAGKNKEFFFADCTDDRNFLGHTSSSKNSVKSIQDVNRHSESFHYKYIPSYLDCQQEFVRVCNNTRKICTEEYGHYPLNLEIGVAA